MKICLGQNKKLWAAIKQSKEQQQRSRWGMGTNTWSYGSPGQQGFGISELGSSSSRSSSYKMDRGTLLSAKQPLLWPLLFVLMATERTLGAGGDSRAGEAAQGSPRALLAAHESRSIPGTELSWAGTRSAELPPGLGQDRHQHRAAKGGTHMARAEKYSSAAATALCTWKCELEQSPALWQRLLMS